MLVKPLARMVSAPLYMYLPHIDMGDKACSRLHRTAEFIDAVRAVTLVF
jgi:hypothetical protein